MISTAILLTVHNRKEKTLRCLDTLFSQKIPQSYKFDVFLTDDGCTDGTPDIIIDKYPEVHIIKGDGNLFWNRGMYKAWEAAATEQDYDYYLWLNDDTTLLSGTLSALLNEAEECLGSVIVGPTHSSSDLKKLSYSGHFSGRLIYPNGYLQPCETFHGNIVLIPRTIFHLLGNLDWTYRHAIGDFDYGWMVTRSGNHSYVSREFRGICDNNPRPPLWVLPDVPFKRRWKNFHSPLGYGQPGPMFHFNLKNFGLTHAVRVWVTNHIRVFFPWLKKQ